MHELEDDVIPLEISGSVKIYSQAYINKQEKYIANLQSELEKKRLAIKNRNTRIKNLRANLTGTQNALEKRNKELAEAKELLYRFVSFEECSLNFSGGVYKEYYLKDIEQAKKLLKEE